MSNQEIEYERLKKLFEEADSSQAELVEPLLKEAAFMHSQLDKLKIEIRKHGAVQFSKSGNQRQTEAAKYYTKLVTAYSNVIKQLSKILGRQIVEEHDEFDDFMEKLNS